MTADALGFMLHKRYGEVHGQDGIGIHQKVITVGNNLLNLLVWTVLLAEETWTGGNGSLIHAGSRRDDAGWIPLQTHRRIAVCQFASLRKA